ncbi:MAG TPA: DUF3089 domain-containing protein [Rhizomicrobium sp.]|nr:DUF3089 domain-containing protein [Rhizomicrobium sp.]
MKLRMAAIGAAALLAMASVAWAQGTFYANDLPFDPAKTPPAPDYAQSTAWAALPGTPNPTDAAPPGEAVADAATAPVDVFFIYPTSFFSPTEWNAAIDDATTNKRTDDGSLRNQASVFNGCCAIYAPRYRQMSLRGFVHHTPAADQAMDVAYSDVKRAFEYYLAHYNHGRPFIIAGHSQGARQARTLLADMIDGTPLQKQLVAAYVVGNWIDEDWFKARKTLKPCERADDTGCVLTWSSVLEGSDAAKLRWDFVQRSGDAAAAADHRYVCTNPLSWTTADTLAPKTDNLGGWVYGRGKEPLPVVPDLVSARCDDGALFISDPEGIVWHALALPGGNYHDYDYQLTYMNIRKNAETRVQAYLARHK